MLAVAFRYVSAVLRTPPNWGNETERIMSWSSLYPAPNRIDHSGKSWSYARPEGTRM